MSGAASVGHVYLKERDWELGVDLSGDPDSRGRVNILCLQYSLQQLVHKVQPEVAVLEQNPGPLRRWSG